MRKQYFIEFYEYSKTKERKTVEFPSYNDAEIYAYGMFEAFSLCGKSYTGFKVLKA